MRTFRLEGGLAAYHERQARLAEPPATPHRPRPLPAPDPDHYRRLAQDKRREARSIERHIPGGRDDVHTRFARRQVRALLDEADALEVMAGGAS